MAFVSKERGGQNLFKDKLGRNLKEASDSGPVSFSMCFCFLEDEDVVNQRKAHEKSGLR